MSGTLTVERPPEQRQPERPATTRRRRPRDMHAEDLWVLLGCAVSATSVVWLLFDQFTALSGAFGFVVCSVVIFLAIYWCVTIQLHGRLVANDRLLSAAVAIGTLALAIPLVLMLVFLVQKGWGLLSVHLFFKDLKGVGPLSKPGSGGLSMAIVGTLEQVGLAILWGVPAGIITAVFLNEVKGRFTATVRTVVTAMSGLPSIMAGVFIYSIWIVTFGEGFSGLAGSFAIAIMLLPSITRTTEEVLKVVSGGLREAVRRERRSGAPSGPSSYRLRGRGSLLPSCSASQELSVRPRRCSSRSSETALSMRTPSMVPNRRSRSSFSRGSRARARPR